MATKKTDVKEDVELKEAEAQEAQQEQKPKDPWDEKVPMIVPRKPHGEDQQYYVCVNDRRFSVPANGKMQELPKPVAKILQESLEAEAAAEDFMDSMPNRSGEEAQMHAI